MTRARTNTNPTPDTDADGNVLIANEVAPTEAATGTGRIPNPTSTWTLSGRPNLAPTADQLGFALDLHIRAGRMDETNKDAEGYVKVQSANMQFAGENLGDPVDRLIHDAVVVDRATGEVRPMTGVALSQKISSYQGQIQARVTAGFAIGATPATDPGAAPVVSYKLDDEGNVVKA